MKHLLLFFLLLGTFRLQAQSERYSIKATVTDTLGEALPYATTMLLHPVDSTLVTFGRTDEKGVLEFRNLKRESYLLKVNYVGYIPYQVRVNPPDGNLADLGQIRLYELNKDLMEVVVKTARAPLSIRGDTVEYNASSFKVPPGSTVEDLLRRLPGVQVDQAGNITAQGQSVRRVTVDGKRFFGDDPKAATRNLPAEAIDKVQVYDSKTDEARLTGVDDGTREKTVNLALKDSHKRGGFGKATVGVGTDHRAQGKLNYNRFDDKTQFAVIGMGNNVNQTGVSGDDYNDFRGSQAATWRGGQFGFGASYERSDDIEVNWGGNRDRGFSTNWAGGVNYNYETPKTKFGSYYFFNQTRQTQDAFTERENFLEQLRYRSADQNSRISRNQNHRTFIRFEKQIDSLNTVVIDNQIRLANGYNNYSGVLSYYGNKDLQTRSETRNTSDFNTFAISTSLLYNRKFEKKGRSWAVSALHSLNDSDEDADQFARNTFYRESLDDSLYILDQRNRTGSLNNRIRLGTMFIEPLASKVFLEGFYNFSVSTTDVEREVFDKVEQGEIRNDFLTRAYDNTFYSNRGGVRLRYTSKGFNISGGLAGQHYGLKANFSEYGLAGQTKLSRRYFGLIPNLTISNQFTTNFRAYLGYSPYMDLPSITDLQPIVDYSNPLFIREGNPDLKPITVHTGYFSINYFNPGSFLGLFLYGNVYYQDNAVVYAQTVDENLVTYTRPVNVSGARNYNISSQITYPIIKTKLILKVGTGIQQGYSLTPINGVNNATRTRSFPTGGGIDLTPGPAFSLFTNVRWNSSRTKYSINTSQNQRINNLNVDAESNIRLMENFLLNATFRYMQFVNDRQGIDLKQPILNMALYKIMLKNNKGEVRLTAFDIFNRNQGIRVYTSQNFTSREQITTLGRYFMLSLTYNMRGISSKPKNNQMMIIY